MKEEANVTGGGDYGERETSTERGKDRERERKFVAAGRDYLCAASSSSSFSISAVNEMGPFNARWVIILIETGLFFSAVAK